MPSFKKKNITETKRVCLRLKQTREQKKISLKELAEKTKINIEHLRALEECRFKDIGHNTTYQKHFVKKYVEALGQDASPFLSQFSDEELSYKDLKIKHPHAGYKKHYFSNIPQAFRYGVVVILVLLVSLYLGNQIRNTLQPPLLTLTTPQDGFITENNTVNVEGITNPEVTVTINGEIIISNEIGNFSEEIALTPGINTITVEAAKKHGKTNKQTRNIIMKEVPGFGVK